MALTSRYGLDPQRIARAVSSGYRSLEWVRSLRESSVKSLVGPRYGQCREDDGKFSGAINLIAQTFVTLLPSLCPSELRHTCRVTDPRLELEGMVVAAALDHRAREEDLPETLRLAVADALLSAYGVLVTRLKAGNDLYKIEGSLYDTGAVVTNHLDLNDYAIDPTHFRHGEASWEALRWRATREQIRAAGRYDPDAIDALPTYRSKGGDDEREELFETIQCWDVYLYRGDTTICVTLGGNFSNSGDPTHEAVLLDEYEYQGPGHGPFRRICFYDVPGRSEPLPPVLLWKELHEAMRRVGDKVIESILAIKSVVPYTPQGVDDVKEIVNAGHLQTVKTQNPDAVRVVEFNSFTESIASGFEWVAAKGSEAAGNIRQRAGISSGADTATEASILDANSDSRIKWMRERINSAYRKVANDRAWYIITDPLINRMIGVRSPQGATVPVMYTAEAREGDAVDFMFDVVPYEPSDSDPNVRLRRITELLSQVLPAVFPMIQAGFVDPQGFVRLISREYGSVDFDQVVAGSPQLQQRLSAMAAMVPPVDSAMGMVAGAPGGGSGSMIDEVRGAMSTAQPGY